MRIPSIYRTLARASLLVAVIIGSFLVAALPAEAQPSCAEGTLTGDTCVIVGDPPVNGTSTCPVSSTVLQTGSECYRLVPRNAVGSCSPGTTNDANTNHCRLPVDLMPGGLRCAPGFTLVESRCERYVDPQCGPAGCRGRITLSYTVTCAGDGFARVSLGTPILENGARVSLITVNGSAVVGADIAGGAAVKVAVTSERLNDEVVVSGPTIAPSCATAPLPVTATPVPTVAPTVAPRPTATAQATPTPEPTAVPAPVPSATVAAATTTPSTDQAQDDGSDPETDTIVATSAIFGIEVRDCDVNGMVEVRLISALDPMVDGAQVQWQLGDAPPSALMAVGAYATLERGNGSARSVILTTVSPVGVADTRTAVVLPDCAAQPAIVGTEPVATQPVNPVAATQNELPLVPLAAIAGVTIVLAATAYALIGRKP